MDPPRIPRGSGRIGVPTAESGPWLGGPFEDRGAREAANVTAAESVRLLVRPDATAVPVARRVVGEADPRPPGGRTPQLEAGRGPASLRDPRAGDHGRRPIPRARSRNVP